MIGNSNTVAVGELTVLTTPDVPVNDTLADGSVLMYWICDPSGIPVNCAQNVTLHVPPELIERLRSLPDIAGVHLMAPGWETEAVPAILAAAGLTSSSGQ